MATTLLWTCVALLTMLAAGAGVTLLLTTPRQRLDAARLLAWSILLGAGTLSLVHFLAGAALRGWGLRLAVTAACLILVTWGARAARHRGVTFTWGAPRGPLEHLMLAVVAAEVALVWWVSFRTSLSWDGLMIFDTKARLAFENGGAVPLAYFSDRYRAWTHPDYPLFLPMIMAWLYGWLGRVDQEAAKVVPPLFFMAAAGLLYAATRSRRRWLLAPLLPAAVPLVVIGDGSASSGLGDFPLAAAYLACLLCLLDEDRPLAERLPLLAGLAALLPWIKQEGALLFCCTLVLASLTTRERRLRVLGRLAWPGLLVFAVWRVFLAYSQAIVGQAFLPIRPSTLMANLARVLEIVPGVLAEMGKTGFWGWFWPAVLFALPPLLPREWRRAQWLLFAAILMPLSLYSAIYIFSAWNPMMLHLTNSMPRLLVQLSLPAMLALSAAATAFLGLKERG